MKQTAKLLMTALFAACVALALPTSTALAQRGTGNDEKSEKKDQPKDLKEIAAGTKVMYMIDCRGEVGRHVSENSIKSVLADAKKWQPDFLVFKLDMPYLYQGRPIAEWQASLEGQSGKPFAQLETVRELQTFLTDGIRDDPTWKTRDGGKPELIMWVKQAMGGSAFLPFIAPSIYYTSDAHHGGIGYLEYTLRTGDRVVHEKMYAARLGRAEGLALKGGHDPRILRAMARMDYVLSVSYVGGKPVYFENSYAGEETLTDDGNPDAGTSDDIEDIVRLKGNDCLTLDSATGIKLGVAKAIVDTNDELAGELGCARNHVVINGKAGEVMKKWVTDVSKAERELNDNTREFMRTRVEGETPADRNRGRGKQMRLLKEMGEIWKKYGESIYPWNLSRDVPDAQEIERAIEILKQQMRVDR